MKLWMILLLSGLVTFSVSAADKVVYGDDNRLDLYETTNTLHAELARSTAAMISGSKLTNRSGDNIKLTGSTLSGRGICADAKFADQLTTANCSGFLVGPNLIVTAGHCIRSQSDCNSYKWVFDFAITAAEQSRGEMNVKSENVYNCKRIIERTLDRSTMNDYALIELDREVSDRAPLAVRTEGKIEARRPLVVIGHPTGLPSKVSAGAYVRDNSNDYYLVSNLDTFGGNSGSAVFDAETGMVEGILVRGETDYVYDSSRGCRVPKVCTNEGCRGEDVTRITNIHALMNLVK